MRSSHLTRSPLLARLVAVVVAALLGFTAACGSDDPAAEDTPSPTVTPSVTSSATPTPTPKPTSTPTPTASPTEDPDDQVGDGDSEGDDSPATAGGGVCGELSSDEVGTVLAGTVTGSALGGTGGCKFVQADRKAPSATVIDKPFRAGGIDAAKNDATSSVEGTPEDLLGVGKEAFVVTGTVFGGTAIQGAGAVQVGSRLVSMTLTQEKGLSRARVRDLVISLLKLAVAELD